MINDSVDSSCPDANFDFNIVFFLNRKRKYVNHSLKQGTGLKKQKSIKYYTSVNFYALMIVHIPHFRKLLLLIIIIIFIKKKQKITKIVTTN